MHIALTSRFSLHPNSTPQGDSYQSLVISLLRGLAAVQVALAHLRAEVYPSLRGMVDAPLTYQLMAFFTGFAHQAVVVFFLISGWLVGGSLLNKWTQQRILESYAIDRISRLWTVLVPTFVLILLCASLTGRIEPTSSHLDETNAYSTVAFVGNLIGLQTISVPNFGQNYALWSLANETWYYILFPLLLLAFRCKSAWRRAVSVLAIAGIASFLPLPILLYFSLWLLGAGFSRLRIECGNLTRLGLLATTTILSIYYRLNGSNADLIVESFLQDLACSLPFLVLLASMHRPAQIASPAMRSLRTAAQALSEFSFTLYVTHVPIIAFLRYFGQTYLGRDKLSPHHAFDYVIYFCTASLLVGIAYLLYLAFEANTCRVRRFMKRKLLFRGGGRSGTVAASIK
jgi:peptidoglycan/LPS O-acetylase OafA/YrhL